MPFFIDIRGNIFYYIHGMLYSVVAQRHVIFECVPFLSTQFYFYLFVAFIVLFLQFPNGFRISFVIFQVCHPIFFESLFHSKGSSFSDQSCPVLKMNSRCLVVHLPEHQNILPRFEVSWFLIVWEYKLLPFPLELHNIPIGSFRNPSQRKYLNSTLFLYLSNEFLF